MFLKVIISVWVMGFTSCFELGVGGKGWLRWVWVCLVKGGEEVLLIKTYLIIIFKYSLYLNMGGFKFKYEFFL